jgi:hypothetical protein
MTVMETGEPVSPSCIDYGPAMATTVTSHPPLPRASCACIDDIHSSCLAAWLSSSNQSIHRHSQTDDDHHIPYIAPFDLTYADDVIGVLPYHPQIHHTASHQTHPITVVGISPQCPAPATSMADLGANVCVTSDPSILIDVIDIDPIPLGVAATSPDAPTTFCTKQGYLPIPLLDGSYHYQPFLYNPNATDTILSPAHVMWSSPSISSWRQSGSKDPSVTDTLSFLDSNGNDLLVLPLTTQNGLQYCSNAPTPPMGMRSMLSYLAASVSAASTA